MKILIPVLGFGKQGGYRVLSNLANTWIELGHQVTFLSISDTDLPHYPTNAKIIWVDKKGICLTNLKNENKHKLKFFIDLFSLYKGLNSFNKYEFDVVLANQSHTTYPVYFCKLKSLKTYYIQLDEVESQLVLGGFKNYILSFLSFLSYFFDLFRIVNAPFYLNYKYIKSKDYVLPAMDFNIFFPNKVGKVSLKDKKVTIGCIGRRAAWKGTNDVLDAFELLKKENLNIELKVAFGEEDLKTIPGVSTTYPKNDIELASFYKSLDILIAPATIQIGAVHYPVIEAMACGIPVITTGYYPANDQNAWIVKINDPSDIAMKIKMVICDDFYYEKIKNALHDTKELSWYNSSLKMIKCFQQKINSKGK
ncbi:glycosyltransferase family 4 protein [Chitinophagaceae bacterium LB-8]|uniref:Glycosyltransferase family 4 protein n=1 Tax=Paraflavisolibacter caeni TaxID=2982496 RepID=A0A9X3B7I2_9BACT|nr:glycosyltransferase family 4 protein [Paraflavisolibacter caeni]MCU7548496.1 glycosyltransferase family 4 protein [Paraflavisolibacter caeni]